MEWTGVFHTIEVHLQHAHVRLTRIDPDREIRPNEKPGIAEIHIAGFKFERFGFLCARRCRALAGIAFVGDRAIRIHIDKINKVLMRRCAVVTFKEIVDENFPVRINVVGIALRKGEIINARQILSDFIIKALNDPKYGFIGPRYLDIDDFGHLIIADQDAHRIVKIDPLTGDLLGTIGDGLPGLGPNKFDDPEGVAVHGNVYYFSDSDNNRIVKYVVVTN